MSSGSEETRTGGERTGSGQTGNVVRIPRDWFGPKDELVPFGPRASEAVKEEKARSGVEDPNRFWGEDAGSVHDVLVAPAVASEKRRRRSLLLAAAALVAVLAGVGVTLTTLEGPEPHGAQSLAAPAGHEASGRPSPLLALRAVAGSVMERQRASGRAKARRVTASPTSPTDVAFNPHEGQASANASVYRPQQSQPATSVSYSPSQSSTGSAVQSTSPGPATVASTPPSTQRQQPAFGSSGALGPMSSPDG